MTNPIYSHEAEDALLGSVLIAPETFYEATLILSHGMQEFFIDRHKEIWNAYAVLRNNLQEIDILTVADQLDRTGFDGDAAAYLIALINRAPQAYNASAYAQIVHDNYVRRQMLEAATEVAQLAVHLEKPVAEIKSEAVRAITDVALLGESRHMTRFEDGFTEVTDRVVEASRLQVIPGIRTGIYDLDRMLDGGLHNGNLIEVANRPGGGKTAFLTQVAAHAALEQGKRVAIFSMEMSQHEINRRIISQQLEIGNRALKTGRLDEDEWRKFRNAGHLRAMDITVDDTPALTPEQLAAKVDLLINSTGLDLICVDYLALMTSTMRFNKRHEEIDYFARELKRIARTYNIPVLVANQMNRNIEGRGKETEPVLADLNEGGEKDADIVIFIHHVKEGDVIESSHLKVAKHRDGQMGKVDVYFRGEYTRFENVTSVAEQ